MSTDPIELTSSDVAVLDSLHGAMGSISQRELARRTGLSVGLINAVIKKLVRTGYVKTGHLNRRSLEYLLTPQGFAHTALRSYHYILDTVRRYQSMQVRMKAIIDGLSAEGIADFYLHGDGELAELVALFFVELGKGDLRRGLPPGRSKRAAVLNAAPVTLEGKCWRVVNLVRELGNGNDKARRPQAAAAEVKEQT